MPSEDVTDLRDVVDAINKLCDTMKTSSYDEETFEDCTPSEVEMPLYASSVCEEVILEEAVTTELDSVEIAPEEVIFKRVENYNTETWRQSVSRSEMVSPEEVAVQRIESHVAERWSDSASQISLPGQTEDTEAVASDRPGETYSEMYYTASSEVSLLSDLESTDRVQEETPPERDKEDRKECVIAGHVAAMRERFESMTRTNTPCPDLVRSVSPSLDVFRNVTPSPDRLG